MGWQSEVRAIQPPNINTVLVPSPHEVPTRAPHREHNCLDAVYAPDLPGLRAIRPSDFVTASEVLPIRDWAKKSAEQFRSIGDEPALYERLNVFHGGGA